MLHQHALFSKAFPTKMKDVLSPEVIAVNATEAYGLTHHLSCDIYFFFEENVSSTLLLSLENNMAFFEPRYYSFSKICEKVHHFLHSGST